MKTIIALLCVLCAWDASAEGRQTYTASASGQNAANAMTLSIEGTAFTGIKITRVCFTTTGATAQAVVSVTVRRTTAAATGGTTLTAEGTGTTTVSKMDPNIANFPGVAKIGGTITSGATIDQWGFVIGTIGGTEFDRPFCQSYGLSGAALPQSPTGTANGLAVIVSAAGAGALGTGGNVSVEFIAEAP